METEHPTTDHAKRIESFFSVPCTKGISFRILLAVLLLGTGLYWFLGTTLIYETNRNRLNSDQQYNIDLARESGGTLWPAYSKGVVSPLWPWVVSFFQDKESDEATFMRGRWINLTISWIALIGCVLAFSRVLPLVPLLVGSGLTAFGCFLPQAVYFQPETLYYLFFLGAWACCCVLLWKNPIRLYVALGALGGLAYLAKGSSVMPLLAVFTGISGLRWLLTVFPLRKMKIPPKPVWKPRRCVAGLLAMGSLFLLLLTPFLAQNQKRFGDPFHSFPSYWMWQEDFGSESIPFMHAFKKKQSLTPEETPSLQTYLHRYGWEHAQQRLCDGIKAKWRTFLFPEPGVASHKKGKPWREVLRFRGMYPIILLFGTLLLVTPAWKRMSPAERWNASYQFLFFVGTLSAYTILYGWYDKIGRGDRFMMSLYTPLIFCPLLASQQMLRNVTQAWRWGYYGSLIITGILMLQRLMQLLTTPHFL